jgi:hypothetical protein
MDDDNSFAAQAVTACRLDLRAHAQRGGVTELWPRLIAMAKAPRNYVSPLAVIHRELLGMDALFQYLGRLRK